MENNISTPPGNRKQRRQARRLLKEMGIESESARVIVLKPAATLVPKSKAKDSDGRNRFNELLNIFGFACTLAAWGWSVIAPDTSMWFGSFLFLIAILSMLVAILRAWPMHKAIASLLVIAALSGFGAFDWYVVVKPQRGKPFKELLAAGYHLTDECNNRPAREPMPTWMRDESKAWQAQVQQLVMEKLDPKDLQTWRGAIVMGLVTDENMTAYQCMWLGEKVAALETIVNAHYDPGLKHQEYQGPLYWLESVDGKVDVTEAFKRGATRITIHEKPIAGSTVEIRGKVSH